MGRHLTIGYAPTRARASPVDSAARRVDLGSVQLFLVRHADAAFATPALSDADRYLTRPGRDAARSLGDRLRWYDCRATAMWTSPLTRAVQTAEILASGLHWTGMVESVPALAPGGDAHHVLARLSREPLDGVLVIVGHEPDLSGLGTLVTRRADFPGLRKAEAARIDGTHLRWLFAVEDEAPRPASSFA
jgi:phosphohistidine phosphatase